ncbi:CRIB domain-containing protein RIC10-like [Silene latifolia]|uniref:CRIB domain-containing protein RIC10-like n=1 Tax=Silene latifolia TaxID=37657 RepID=UPI003D77DBCB
MTSTKIKGICKGSFKYISHLFVVKERELEIGSPTDVKHVAHIGWNSPDSTSPSWMNEFKAGSDMAVTSIGSIGGSNDPTWSSHDFEHTLGRQQSSAKLSNFPPANMPSIPDKQTRKKNRSSSSTPKTSSARSSRSSKHKKVLSNSEDGNTRQSLRL